MTCRIAWERLLWPIGPQEAPAAMRVGSDLRGDGSQDLMRTKLPPVLTAALTSPMYNKSRREAILHRSKIGAVV